MNSGGADRWMLRRVGVLGHGIETTGQRSPGRRAAAAASHRCAAGSAGAAGAQSACTAAAPPAPRTVCPGCAPCTTCSAISLSELQTHTHLKGGQLQPQQEGELGVPPPREPASRTSALIVCCILPPLWMHTMCVLSSDSPISGSVCKYARQKACQTRSFVVDWRSLQAHRSPVEQP